MFSRIMAPLLTLLIVTIASKAPGQTPASAASKPTAPGLVKLTGDDEKRAKRLAEQIDKSLTADRWDEAIAEADELLDLRKRGQGSKHFETVNEEWRLKALRRVAPCSHDERMTYLSTRTIGEQAKSLMHKGEYALAQPLLENVLEIYRRLLTDDHPYTATSFDDLAADLNALGKYAAAQTLYEKGLDINRRLLTDDHPDSAASYNNVALNLGAQGKYARAQPLYEKALEIYRRLLTDNHRNTATCYNNVAANLNSQGKYNLAQPLYAKALEIHRRLLTDDHLDTANSYSNLGLNFMNQGQYALAQPLCERALEIRRRLLTDDHPVTANSYTAVANNLNVQGKHAEAQPLYEKALSIRRRLLTDDHPVTANGYHNLAYNLNAQGKYVQAQPLYEKALLINRRLLTDDHPYTATCYSNAALNLYLQRKYSQAWPLYGKALEIRRRLLTDDHPDTAASYVGVAYTLAAQGKYAEAQPLIEKALEIRRRILTDAHPYTASSYDMLARNLCAQGEYAAAQALHVKGLEINRRLLTDDHPETAVSYNNLAATLNAQGKYLEAKDQWQRAVKSLDAARLRIAFTGLERAEALRSMHPALAALLARLGQPNEACQSLEEDLGRGLLDELAARKDRRIAPDERARLRELTAELERLDKLAELTPKNLELADRSQQSEDLKRQRELASIALGEFHTKLVKDYGPLAGQVARLNEIQAALPSDAALVAWVDLPSAGPNAADPDGEHWGVVVRSRGTPAWAPIAGTGKDGHWTSDDTELAGRVRTELRARPSARAPDLMRTIDQLRAQRLAPLAKALGADADGLPTARRLIVLPSRAMAGIPVEALLAHDEAMRRTGQQTGPAYQPEAPASASPRQTRRANEADATKPPMWTVSYAPSGTVFKYLREQPRADRHAGILAVGDPVYAHPDKSSAPKPEPDHGLLLNVVVRGSNAARHGLKDGDVLLAYNGHALSKKDDLKTVTDGDKPIPIEVWRDGVSSRHELTPGKLGVVIDPRPAREAIAEQRKLQQVLTAARSGGEDFSPLPGTRREVEAIAQLFRSDDRPARALLGPGASEPELDRFATSGELARFGFIHLATHGVIDEAIPRRSAVILTQTGLPDPLEQVLNHKPAYDGRLSVREIQHDWDLKAELVTFSACETALGKESGGEGFVGFTQALLMSGARTVCLSLWKVDDTATALLMTRFYQNLLGKRTGLSKAMPKAEALGEAKKWLRELTTDEADVAESQLPQVSRGDVRRRVDTPVAIHPYEHPHFWAAFIVVGDPD
jgi:tetratricopeptide (TPR) repeat protein